MAAAGQVSSVGYKRLLYRYVISFTAGERGTGRLRYHDGQCRQFSAKAALPACTNLGGDVKQRSLVRFADSQWFNSEARERFLEYVSLEVPEYNLRNAYDRKMLQQVLQRIWLLTKKKYLDSAAALQIFLALGDVVGLPTRQQMGSTPWVLPRKAERASGSGTPLSYTMAFKPGEPGFSSRTDIFTQLSPVEYTDIMTGKSRVLVDPESVRIVRSIQTTLVEVLACISPSSLSEETVALVSEIFELLPLTGTAEKLINKFWKVIVNRLEQQSKDVQDPLCPDEQQLVTYFRHQAETHVLMPQYIDILVKRIQSNFIMFEENHISEVCTLFGTLRYKDERWITLLAQRLPVLLHQYHFSTLVHIAEMLCTLNLGVPELGQLLPGGTVEAQEFIDRIAHGLWKWVPRMAHNYPCRAIRVLVYLDTQDTRTVDALQKYLARSLARHDLHDAQLLAETFIACVLHGPRRR